MVLENGSHKINQMVYSAKLWARHNKVIALVKLDVGVWVRDKLIDTFGHPLSLIWVAVCFELNSIL